MNDQAEVPKKFLTPEMRKHLVKSLELRGAMEFAKRALEKKSQEGNQLLQLMNKLSLSYDDHMAQTPSRPIQEVFGQQYEADELQEQQTMQSPFSLGY